MFRINKLSFILLFSLMFCDITFGSTYYIKIHKIDDSIVAIPNSDIVKIYFQGTTGNRQIVIERTSTTTDYVLATTDITKITFQETDGVIDIEGNEYSTVQIGSQTWMAENLKVTKYNDVSSIPNIQLNTAWASLTSDAYCAYNNSETNAVTYGYIYNWYAVNTGKLAPTGWHVPSDEEWKELEMALGMTESAANYHHWRGTNEGSKLAGSADLWTNGVLENNVAFGLTDFAGLPGGHRNGSSSAGTFDYISSFAFFWTSTVYDGTSSWHRRLYYDLSTIYRLQNYNDRGCSVRCVKD